MKKRVFALFLALALALGLLPMSALAAEDPIGTVTVSVETKTIDGGYLVEPMEEAAVRCRRSQDRDRA